MSQFQDTENVDPRHIDTVSSQHVKQQPTLKNYTNSIIKKQNQQPIQWRRSDSTNTKINQGQFTNHTISQTRVPVINSIDPNDIKVSVRNALKHDSNRFEVGILKQNINSNKNTTKSLKSSSNELMIYPNSISPKSPLESIHPLESIKINTGAYDKKSPNIDDLSLLEIYSKDHNEDKFQDSEPKSGGKSIFMSNNSPISANDVEQQTGQKYDFDDEYYEDINDPRISYLNPHTPFVDVIPKMLGQPLASNDTPLDLSSVSRLQSASPFFGFEESNVKITKDEARLYEALKYEMSFPICSINWKGETVGPPFNQDEDFEFEKEDRDKESSPNGPDFGQKSSNWIGSFFQKVLRLGPFSSESKLYDKYPWAKIFYDVDQEKSPTNENHEHELNRVGESSEETDNTDMYPAKYSVTPLDEFVENYANLRRQKHAFVPAV